MAEHEEGCWLLALEDRSTGSIDVDSSVVKFVSRHMVLILSDDWDGEAMFEARQQLPLV